MPSNDHYVCLECHIALKHPCPHRGGRELISYRCSECRKPMRYAGRAFKAPRRNAVRQWKKVELLLRAGHLFEPNFGRQPATLREVAEFIATRARPVRIPSRASATDADGAAAESVPRRAPGRRTVAELPGWWTCTACGARNAPSDGCATCQTRKLRKALRRG